MSTVTFFWRLVSELPHQLKRCLHYHTCTAYVYAIHVQRDPVRRTCTTYVTMCDSVNTTANMYVILYGIRYMYEYGVHVWLCRHRLNVQLPPYLAVDCVPVTSLPSRRHLRSAESGCLAITGARTTLGSRNIAVAGAKIWNSLPVDLRLLSQSLRTFGHKLKHCLFVSEPWAHLRFFKFALYKFSSYYY